jgi:hypothetical protein
MIAWFIICCCWIVSFFFNGIEGGLLSIDPVRLRKNVKHRVPAAVRVNRLLKDPERLLQRCCYECGRHHRSALPRQLVQAYGYVGFILSL